MGGGGEGMGVRERVKLLLAVDGEVRGWGSGKG